MNPFSPRKTTLTVRMAGRGPSVRHYAVHFDAEHATDGDEGHFVSLFWDGSTDRPNRIICDCGKRSCIPLRLVRDLEKHHALPPEG